MCKKPIQITDVCDFVDAITRALTVGGETSISDEAYPLMYDLDADEETEKRLRRSISVLQTAIIAAGDGIRQDMARAKDLRELQSYVERHIIKQQ